MSFVLDAKLIRCGSAKRLTRASSQGSAPEMDNPLERWL